MKEVDYNYELIQRAMIDLAQKSNLNTPEIYALKYGLSKEKYTKICETIHVCLYKNSGYDQTYKHLKLIIEDEDFSHEKYDELLHAFQTQFELYNTCDGILYKNLSTWICTRS